MQQVHFVYRKNSLCSVLSCRRFYTFLLPTVPFHCTYLAVLLQPLLRGLTCACARDVLVVCAVRSKHVCVRVHDCAAHHRAITTTNCNNGINFDSVTMEIRWPVLPCVVKTVEGDFRFAGPLKIWTNSQQNK